ncbi:restriction endonuclease fold toxin-2 domain-containing protein [Streptomyces sp. NEAU-Y11]|uniref:restriction endonuclease fold toxin-2 domain-containing protein n=1 Tax=Streptomyces cucumeris TaxID=2962890 RepID=UPI0020C8985A|nr:restriction endonuclease fold toxin-2 domain-containing protein [Streptomyces sp. NEAU-Y11]MCP9206824.1 hypothetical protein [Streptomyces sp. NEAU-Y11]MCP9211640.1 hypothetical protein [Streptomyces sp. NEAU-Y11]
MADVHVKSDQLVGISGGFNKHMNFLVEVVNALVVALGASKGMAGDDEGGRNFAKLYQGAAREAVFQMAFSTYTMGNLSANVMQMAFDFLRTDSKVAASMLNKFSPDEAINMLRSPAPSQCDPTGSEDDLPEVVDKETWWDDFTTTGPRGNPSRAKEAGKAWRKAGELLDETRISAQTGQQILVKDWAGQAVTGFVSYFDIFIGRGDRPSKTTQNEALLANIATACHEIADSCDAYAGHVEDAKNDKLWSPPDSVYDNDNDHGLNEAVCADTKINGLGRIPGILDGSGRRAKLPEPSAPWDPGLPSIFPAPPLRVPMPAIPVAAKAPGGTPGPSSVLLAFYERPDHLKPKPPRPGVNPKGPIPPEPGAKRLSPAEQARFRKWMSGLHQHDFANNRTEKDPANRYQADTAGYPEYDLPLPPDGGKKNVQQADGLRAEDGYALDAKYVKKPNSCESPRTLEKLQLPDDVKKPWEISNHGGDNREIRDYGRAINADGSKVKGLEVITNGPETMAYWQYLMAKQGVPGSVRYHPG